MRTLVVLLAVLAVALLPSSLRAQETEQTLYVSVLDKNGHPVSGLDVPDFRVKEDGLNLGSIIETLNRDGAQTVMVQKYLTAISAGDKRVLVIGGEPVPYSLARIPQGSEIRGNLAAGGKGVAQALSDRDREIAATIGPKLAARGLLLIGLDVIGDQLTEINVTSPTCFQEITQQTGFDVPAMFVDALEEALQVMSSRA
jgi:glutathione synthase